MSTRPAPATCARAAPAIRAEPASLQQWSRVALAFHEAGHAVAGVRLLGRTGSVTIAPGSTYAGATEIPSLRRDGDGALLAGGRATWVSNEEAYAWVRDVAERDVMILLAGKEAEDLALRLHRCRELLTGNAASVPPVAADDRAIVESAPASSADAEELAAGDAARKRLPKRDRTDEAKAWRGVLELNPGRDPKVLAAHLEFLRADTRAHLQREWSAVEALAGALLAHTTLSGTAATRIVERHTP